MIKLVSNQISPNLKIGDCFVGLFHLFTKKEIDFTQHFGTKNYTLYNAGRTGIIDLIKKLDIPKHKKIALPAFTCAVTATPFLEAGYNIEWIDVDDHGLIHFTDFKNKAEKNNIGLVLCIHTFGQEVDLTPFQEYSNQKNIFLLADCAHSLADTTRPIQSDARLYSFGREKIISCISGGAITWNEKSKYFKPTFNRNILRTAPTRKTATLLLHPLIYSLSLPWWYLGGKLIPILIQKLKILPPIITSREKDGKEDFPQYQLHPALQHVLKRQFKKYEEDSEHRQKIAKRWKLVLNQKFPASNIIIPKNAFRVILINLKKIEKQKLLHKKGFHLREWDGNPIAPKSIDISKFQYKSGQCPNAEKFSAHYQTFPTNIRTTRSDLKRFEKSMKFNEN